LWTTPEGKQVAVKKLRYLGINDKEGVSD